MTGGERHDNKKSIGKHADLQHVMEMADMPILGRPPTINNQSLLYALVTGSKHPMFFHSADLHGLRTDQV